MSFAVDHDAIVVGAREGLFNAVRIEVDGGDLEMHNIKITFGDGATSSPETRVWFREGSRSRTIDLPGQARIIRRIDFWYRSTLRRGRATVQAFGRRAAAALGPDLAGWDHLGMRPVDFRVDRDVVTAVGQGLFRRIRIDVEGGDLEMFDVRILCGDGDTFSPATRLYFKEGSRSRVIDLPGRARLIRRIDFLYRSVPGGGQGKATVHVWGWK
ncbi:MAG: hypothetical protein ACREMM_06070 [Gemmatimonadales bacterium]